jgi:hypothetical protein
MKVYAVQRMDTGQWWNDKGTEWCDYPTLVAENNLHRKKAYTPIRFDAMQYAVQRIDQPVDIIIMDTDQDEPTTRMDFHSWWKMEHRKRYE